MIQPKRILIVDDDPLIARMYENKLKTDGYDVSVAFNGEEALAGAIKNPPDLIFLDVMMPKMNGVEVLKIMRGDDRTKNIPVLVLTNYENYRDKVEPMGISDYLIKANVTLNDVMERTFKVWGGKIEEKS